MTREELEKTHPDYTAFLSEWKFFINSYLGGKFYRDGDYLLKHPFESEANYKRRKEIAYYYNYCAPIVDIFTSYLYKKSPVRKYGESLSAEVVPPRKPKTLFDAFWWDCDLEGTNFDQFMRVADTYASIYGRVSIIVDKPSVTATTKAEALAKDIRPYLTMITPENLLDWSHVKLLNGRQVLDTVKVREEKDAYRIWNRNGWELWKLIEENPELMDIGYYDLGEIPIINLYNKKSGVRMVGVSDIQDIADINKNIYYFCSDAKEIIENTAFPMLGMPYAPGSPDGKNTEVGPKSIIQFDPEQPNSKPFWLEPPHSSLAEIREWIQQDIEEIYHLACMGGTRNVQGSVQPWSGVSITEMEGQLFARLVEKSTNAEQAELDIFNLYCKWEGIQFEGTVEYPKDFAIRDLTVALQNAITATNAKVSSVVFEKERQKKVVMATLPETDEALREEMFDEIEKNVKEINTGTQGQIYEYHLKAELIKKNEVRKFLGLEPLEGEEGNELVKLQDQAQPTPADASKKNNGGEGE